MSVSLATKGMIPGGEIIVTTNFIMELTGTIVTELQIDGIIEEELQIDGIITCE